MTGKPARLSGNADCKESCCHVSHQLWGRKFRGKQTQSEKYGSEEYPILMYFFQSFALATKDDVVVFLLGFYHNIW